MTRKNNLPQKYKLTEFGEIPQDWVLCTFEDVLTTFSSGATPYRGNPEYYKGNIRWISSGELNYNRITETLEHISQSAVRNTNLRVHQPDTFLIAITGLEAAGTRGKCAFIGAPSTTNQSCMALNGTNKMTVDYLFWFYRMWGNYLAFKYCQGTKQQSYTAAIVKKLPIYCPPTIKEQSDIAEVLNDVDALIAVLDKKIEKRRLIKQGVMQELLTGTKRLPRFDKPWTVKLMQDWIEEGAISLHRGKVISQKDIDAHPGNYPIYSSSVINNGYMGSYAAYMFKRELISWSIDGGGNFFYRPKHKFSLTNVCGYILLDESIFNYRYLAYLLSFLHSKENFDYLIKAHPNVISKIYRLARPEINEQQAIASILSDMDKEIADLEARRDKYTQIKSGMMQKLLTGQIRLR